MSNQNNKFRPFVGRLFQLKNYTDLKKFPEVILVMDETNQEVMFLDNNQTPTWISKFYLRATPVPSRVYASPDTITETMTLLAALRAALVDGEVFSDKKKKEINKQISTLFIKLRDLSGRMQGVRFAPSEESEPENAADKPTTVHAAKE